MEVDNIDVTSNASPVSDDIPRDDIASPDPVQDTAVLSSNKTVYGEDERSQTPLQDEVEGTSEQVTEIAGQVQNVEISETLQQTSQQDMTNVDVPRRGDGETPKQTVRDDHGELDYDEEVQTDGCAAANMNGGSSTDTHQKAVDEEEKEDGEEKVDAVLQFNY